MQLLMRRPEIEGFISIAPPANLYDFSFLAPCPSSGLIVHGDKDAVVPHKDVTTLVEKLKTQKGIVIEQKVIPGANHFFDRKIEPLIQSLELIWISGSTSSENTGLREAWIALFPSCPSTSRPVITKTPPASGLGTPVVLGKRDGQSFDRPHRQIRESLRLQCLSRPSDVGGGLDPCRRQALRQHPHQDRITGPPPRQSNSPVRAARPLLIAQRPLP